MLKRRRTEQDEMLTTRHFQKNATRGVAPRRRSSGPSSAEEQPAGPIAEESLDRQQEEPDPSADEVTVERRARRRASPEARKRRRRRRGSFLRQIGAVAGLFVLAYATLPLLLRAGRIRPVLEEMLSKSLSRRVRIGSLSFSATFGTLVATDVTVADDPAFSSAPFLHARQIELSVRRIPLIFKRSIEITGVALDEPTVTLIHNAAEWNFDALLAAGPAFDDASPAPALHAKRGILVVRASDHHDPFVLRNVNFDTPRISTAVENAFSLSASVGGGGTVALTGRWGPVRLQGRSPVIPLSMLVNAKKVSLADSNLTADVAPGLGGFFSIDGTVESDETGLRVKANADLDKLKFADTGSPTTEPLRAIVALDYDSATHTGTLSRCDITLHKGGAGVQGKFSVDDQGVSVKFQAVAQGVPVTPLAGLLPAAGVPFPPGTTLQGGLVFVDLAIEGNLKAPVTTGMVTLNNTKLTNFDLEERLASVDGLDALHISRDLAIDEWRAKVRMTPDTLELSGMEVDVPEVGIFTGGGVIDGNRTLDFQMGVTRHGVSDKRVIPFVVRGACISPVFRQPGRT
jgi:AsmA protein